MRFRRVVVVSPVRHAVTHPRAPLLLLLLLALLVLALVLVLLLVPGTGAQQTQHSHLAPCAVVAVRRRYFAQDKTGKTHTSLPVYGDVRQPKDWGFTEGKEFNVSTMVQIGTCAGALLVAASCAGEGAPHTPIKLLPYPSSVLPPPFFIALPPSSHLPSSFPMSQIACTSSCFLVFPPSPS